MRSSIAFLAVSMLVSCSKKEGGKTEAKPTTTTPAPQVKKPVDTTPLPPLAADPGGATGKPMWGVGFGGLGIDSPRGVALAQNGDIYVAGYFDGEADFGPGGKHVAPAPAERKKGEAPPAQAYLVKIGDGGAIAWARTWGAERDDLANAVATRGDTIVVVGSFLDKLELGEVKHKASGSDDLFVATFKSNGDSGWLWTAGGVDSDGANAVAATPDGGWIVGGSFSKTATFGPTDYSAKGGTDAMLVKLAASGAVEWVKQFGGLYNDTIKDIAVDGQGNIYIVGTFRDKAVWGGEQLEAGGAANDVVLAKYDLNGDHLWSQRFGNPFEETGEGIAVDPAGNITIVGGFERSISFGPGDDHSSMGEFDVYVANFSTDGKLQWARTYGADRDDGATGVAVDKFGNTVTTGWFEGAIDFGKGPVSSNGNKDVFTVKLDAKGGLVWAQNWGDKDHDQGRVVAMHPNGESIVGGIYRFTMSVVTPPLDSRRAEGDRIPKPDTFILRVAR